VEGTRDREGWTFAGDFRPHSHHHDVRRQMRASETGAGVIEVGGARVRAFFTSWGDGAFPVLADLGADEKLLRLRVDLGGDETVRRLRHVLGKQPRTGIVGLSAGTLRGFDSRRLHRRSILARPVPDK
jgi:hypothetical protein